MIGFGWSAAWGLGLGLAYALAAHATHRLAFRRPARFTQIVLGGLVARLLFTLSLLLLVLALAPLDRAGFVTGFFATFVVGLVYEVLSLARHRPPPTPET